MGNLIVLMFYSEKEEGTKACDEKQEKLKKC